MIIRIVKIVNICFFAVLAVLAWPEAAAAEPIDMYNNEVYADGSNTKQFTEFLVKENTNSAYIVFRGYINNLCGGIIDYNVASGDIDLVHVAEVGSAMNVFFWSGMEAGTHQLYVEYANNCSIMFGFHNSEFESSFILATTTPKSIITSEYTDGSYYLHGIATAYDKMCSDGTSFFPYNNKYCDDINITGYRGLAWTDAFLIENNSYSLTAEFSGAVYGSGLYFIERNDNPYLGNDTPFNFAPYNNCQTNMTCQVPYYYWQSIFTSATDYFEVWQCEGENQEVPNCNDLTAVGSSTVWNFWDKKLNNPTGKGTFPFSATSSVYRNYKAVARSSIFTTSFDPVYFSIQFGDYNDVIFDWASSTLDMGYWCDNPCYGISTSTIGGSIECGFKQLFCWAFAPASSSFAYFSDSFSKIKTKFPMSAYFDLSDALTGFAATTTATQGFRIPVPSVGLDGKATITMETLITASTTQKVIGKSNYHDIRLGIVWFLWILFAGYVIIRLNHKHI